MEKVIERTIEPEFDKMCAACGLPAVYLTEDGICLSSREFIYRLFTDLAQTKKALDLANECVAHYADAGKWAHQDITDLSSGSPITVHTVVAFSKRSVEYGYDKARKTQKEIEKLLGGGE